MIDTIDHIIIAVRDLGAAKSTYTRILGREPSWEGEHPGLGSSNLIYRLRNTYLEFVAATGEGQFADMIRTKLDQEGEGLMGLVFGTVNADACVRHLKAAGLNPTDPIPGGAKDAAGNERSWRNVMLVPEETGGLFMFVIEQEDRLAIPLSPAADGVNGRAAVDAVDHVVVNTPRPDELIAFFEGQLGLRLALDHTIEKWGVRQLFFRVGNVTLEVVTPTAKDEVPEKDSLWGIAYRAPDLALMQERLTQAGVNVSEVRTGRKKGTLVATVKPETHGIPTLLIGQDPTV
ncbi:VOC family protein [Parvibaculaceae bacterium PLY_AMNH_Bact1]|nr:VOC family protein [Parvibaculaceae bacterium PLY_AMNH_Bact1]